MLTSAALRKKYVHFTESQLSDSAAENLRPFRPQGSLFRRTAKRTGFTLVEVILVIGLIVVMSAIVLPNLFGWRESERIRNEGDNLRALLAGLRIRAIEEASPITFSFSNGDTHYKVSIVSDQIVDGSAATTSEDSIIDFDSPNLFAEHELPTGFILYAGSRRPVRDVNKTAPIDAAAMSDKDNRATVRFFPDGSATDGEVELVDQFGIGMTVRVSGLTGNISLSEIYNTGEKPKSGGGTAK